MPATIAGGAALLRCAAARSDRAPLNRHRHRRKPTLERPRVAARVPPGRVGAACDGPAAASWRRWAADRVRVSRRPPRVAFGRANGSPSAARRSGTAARLGACRAVRLSSRPAELEVDLPSATLLVHDGGVVRRVTRSRSAPPTRRRRRRLLRHRQAARAPSSARTTAAASSRFRDRQPNLPEGWSGGDRLAIHGSPTPTWGEPVSNGCLHAGEADLRYLMKSVPLGTPVRIHA